MNNCLCCYKRTTYIVNIYLYAVSPLLSSIVMLLRFIYQLRTYLGIFNVLQYFFTDFRLIQLFFQSLWGNVGSRRNNVNVKGLKLLCEVWRVRLWYLLISISPLRLLRLTDRYLNSLALRHRSAADRWLSLVLRLNLALIDLFPALVTPENGLALLSIDLVDEVFEVLLSLPEFGFSLADVLRIREAVDLPLCLPDLTLKGSLLLSSR